MALPAQLHASVLLSEKLRCRRGWTETGESIHKGYGLGKGQVEQEGRMRSSRRVCRSKRRVAISKRIVVRSSKRVQAQKTSNEVQKKCFPIINTCMHACIHPYIHPSVHT